MFETGQSICIVEEICGKLILDRILYNTSKQLTAQENLSFGCPSRLMSPQKVKNQYFWIHAFAEMIIKEVNSYR
jgi:hypothetical protein